MVTNLKLCLCLQQLKFFILIESQLSMSHYWNQLKTPLPLPRYFVAYILELTSAQLPQKTCHTSKDKRVTSFHSAVNPIMGSLCVFAIFSKCPAKVPSKPFNKTPSERLQNQYRDTISHLRIAQWHNLSRLNKSQHSRAQSCTSSRCFTQFSQEEVR